MSDWRTLREKQKPKRLSQKDSVVFDSNFPSLTVCYFSSLPISSLTLSYQSQPHNSRPCLKQFNHTGHCKFLWIVCCNVCKHQLCKAVLGPSLNSACFSLILKITPIFSCFHNHQRLQQDLTQCADGRILRGEDEFFTKSGMHAV
jgi:hypothetical protein